MRQRYCSCGDIRWIRRTEMGSTHGIDFSGSTRRKHTKRYIAARKQKRGRKRGHNELSESWDSPSGGNSPLVERLTP